MMFASPCADAGCYRHESDRYRLEWVESEDALMGILINKMTASIQEPLEPETRCVKDI